MTRSARTTLPMLKVVCVSSSRADVGIQYPLWLALNRRDDASLAIFLTGMHALNAFARPVEIPAGIPVLTGGQDLGGNTGLHAATAMAALTAAAAELLAQLDPDRLVVVGDRLDMLPAVTAATALNIPIVHLHGGEITQGAIDDRVRHAVTKLSHLHCAATVKAAQRISRMGEESWRISVTGAPGLDTLRLAPPLSIAELAAALEIPAADLPRLRIATVHSETNAADPGAIIHPVLAALAARPAPTLFTAPNSDPGGAAIRQAIEAFVRQHAWAGFRETLGSRLYPAALRHAGLMIGNSSSGVIEAGVFGLPVINIGTRQAGRQHGGQVRHCRPSSTRWMPWPPRRERGSRILPMVTVGPPTASSRSSWRGMTASV
jgi:UDP-hydrolysing UDP-N-acetyl-D-glucosamine 2-epimerase